MSTGSPALVVGFSASPYAALRPLHDSAQSMSLSGLNGSANAVAWSPNGQWLAVGKAVSSRLVIYDARTWAIVHSGGYASGSYELLAWAPDSSQLIAASINSANPIQLYAMPGFAPSTYEHGLSLFGLDRSASYRAFTHTSGVRLQSAYGAAVHTVTTPAACTACAISPDEQWLAYGDSYFNNNKVIRIADLTSSSISAVGKANSHRCIVWSPDSAYLAIGNGVSIYVVRASDRAVVQTLSPGVGTIKSLAWSPDGYIAVAASTFVLYDASDWSLVRSFGYTAASPLSVDFSPAVCLPAVGGRVVDADGAAVSGATVRLNTNAATSAAVAATTSGGDGRFALYAMSTARHVLRVIDNRVGADRVVFDDPTPSLAEQPDPNYVLWALGDPQEFGPGAVTTMTGAAADEAVVVRWSDLRPVARAEPSEQPGSVGAWSADLPPGEYGVIYRADGCRPVLHGPYTVTPAE